MLTPRKRITKKELKEDKLITIYAKSREWAEENYKLITILSAVVVLLIAGSLLISNKRAKSEAGASVQLAKAIHAFDASDYNGAIGLLSSIVDDNGGTKSGHIARLYLAQSLYRTNEYAAAEEHFKKAASQLHNDIHLKTSALAGVACCLEQQGKYAEAAERFKKIVAKYPDAPMASYFLLRAARCSELAQDSKGAKLLYDKLAADYPESQEKNDALMLNALE